MKTIINWLGLDWRRVKNHCRTTDNKDFTDKDATAKFRRQLIISEHTPIRLLEVDWSWKQMPYWVLSQPVRLYLLQPVVEWVFPFRRQSC